MVKVVNTLGKSRSGFYQRMMIRRENSMHRAEFLAAALKNIHITETG
jgi:hypothetical protein